jgi:hypothetical protein
VKFGVEQVYIRTIRFHLKPYPLPIVFSDGFFPRSPRFGGADGRRVDGQQASGSASAPDDAQAHGRR